MARSAFFAAQRLSSALPAFQTGHGMFQSPKPSTPERVPPTVFFTIVMSPRLAFWKTHCAFAGLRFRQP